MYISAIYSITLFRLACANASLKCAQLLLYKGADINKVATSCEFVPVSPFKCACTSGSLELLRFLIERGVTIDDNLLYSSLECLDESELQADKRIAIAAVLISHIKDVSHNLYGCNFLHRICSIGGIENVRLILQRCTLSPDYIYYYIRNFDAALGAAAAKGHLDIVKLLLAWKRPLYRPIELKSVNTAMIEAARHGALEVVKFLTAVGANCQTEALSAVMLTSKSYAVVEYLLDHGADAHKDDLLLDLISSSCSRQSLGSMVDNLPDEKGSIARLLLDRGADRDATDHSGRDALQIAAQTGHSQFICSILDNDMNRPISIERLNEALSLLLGHAEAVKCLLDRGAQVDVLDKDGLTSLLQLCSRDYYNFWYDENGDDHIEENCLDFLPTIQVLLEGGANPNMMSPISGLTALLYASNGRNNTDFSHALSTLLLEHGADINMMSAATGRTPLMTAALSTHMSPDDRISLVMLYLEQGADVMQVDAEGLTVLDMMGANSEYAEVAELCHTHLAAKPLLK